MKERIISAIGRALLARFARTERVCNPADPTSVVQYTFPRRRRAGRFPRLAVIFTASWGVESTVYVLGRQFDAYDHPVAKWVMGVMEDAYTDKMIAYDDGPMGHPGRYM